MTKAQKNHCGTLHKTLRSLRQNERNSVKNSANKGTTPISTRRVNAAALHLSPSMPVNPNS
ncbi:hypothetical protein C7N43_03410 [Sphingobacteriales bacterium UPWRP_1]|nr:hypothetical protein BVG80_08815 [Sphingobacteriales bacterium TSM_CSM]PSJ78526.1 hypothetical protein C7N43_03410 [Sphingobacteriales bacterium UPWRP_1]